MSQMEKKPVNDLSTEDHLPQLWVAAYHDGELRGEALAEAEAHLAVCPVCAQELSDLRQLSSLLGAAPQAQTSARVSDQRFAQEVMQRLPARPDAPWWQPILKGFWKTAPVGLFAVWAFFQTGVVLTQAILLVPGSITAANGTIGLEGGMGLGSLMSALQSFTGSFNQMVPSINVLLIDLLLTGLVAGLFWAWLASWWAVQLRAAKQNKGV